MITAPRLVRATGRFPHRRVLILGEAFVAANGLLGTALLISGVSIPDVAALRSLHLHTWVLPGCWLFVSVVLPSAFATWTLWRRWPVAPAAVQFASLMLLIELLVQLPFLGFDPLQPIMGTVAVVLGLLARRAARNGWAAQL